MPSVRSGLSPTALVQAYIATPWYLRCFSVSPKKVRAGSFLIVVSTQAAFHLLCSTCSVSSRSRLPAVVLISKAEPLALVVAADAVRPGLPPGLGKQRLRLRRVVRIFRRALVIIRVERVHPGIRDRLQPVEQLLHQRLAVERHQQRAARADIGEDGLSFWTSRCS